MMGIRYQKVLGVFSRIGSLGALVALSMALSAPAWAEPKQISILLSSQGSQDFETLMQQAESVAGNFIQQVFAESPNTTEVLITIVGEHNGQQVPLLSSNVSRSNWQTKPNVQVWSRYFGTAESLLGFVKPQQPAATVAVVARFDPIAASLADKEPNFYQ
jgi:hypothetical protein